MLSKSRECQVVRSIVCASRCLRKRRSTTVGLRTCPVTPRGAACRETGECWPVACAASQRHCARSRTGPLKESSKQRLFGFVALRHITEVYLEPYDRRALVSRDQSYLNVAQGMTLQFHSCATARKFLRWWLDKVAIVLGAHLELSIMPPMTTDNMPAGAHRACGAVSSRHDCHVTAHEPRPSARKPALLLNTID